MYIELHARSAFSFLEGASIARGIGCRLRATQNAGHGLARSRWRLWFAAFASRGRRSFPYAPTSARKSRLSAGWRYPLLVESREGYQNLCRLITRMKLRARKGEGSALPEEIAELNRGLICLTGGEEGPLAHALAQGGMEAAMKCVQELCRTFGRQNVYVELQRHFSREEEARNQAAVEIARKLKLPLLATNGVSYAHRQQREVLDVFTCIRHHRTLSTAGRLLSRNSERHLKSHQEMALLFSDLPEAIANTEILSSRLQFTLNDLGYKFPELSGSRWRVRNAIPSRAHARRHDFALWR